MAESTNVETMLLTNPNDPNLIPLLESYLKQQISEETYSLEANLGLLRLYQFEPEKANVENMLLIAIKGMMVLPTMDYQLYLYMIPERFQLNENFVTLANLSQLLETGNYREFWDELNRNRKIMKLVPGFENAIQKFILKLLGQTFSKISRPVLANAININGPSLDKFLQTQAMENDWKVLDNGNMVEIPMDPERSLIQRASDSEKLSFSQVAKVFPILG